MRPLLEFLNMKLPPVPPSREAKNHRRPMGTLARSTVRCTTTIVRSRRSLNGRTCSVLVQPEMEKRRSPLVSIPPFGRGFSRHGVYRSDGGWAAQERVLTPPFIVSMSPPGYPSAWLRPRSARFRFARPDHCSSARPAVSQHPSQNPDRPDPNREGNHRLQ
jgi:hypothetical protein